MMALMRFIVEVNEGNTLVQLSPLERRIIRQEARLVGLCLNGDEALVPDDIMCCARDIFALMQEAYPSADEAEA